MDSQERVKGYIEKVSKAEKQESQQRSSTQFTLTTKCLNLSRFFSSTERTAIDKAAANRFIKHAIAQAVRAQGQSSEQTDQEPTPGPSNIQAQPAPVGAANKMLARAEWEKQVQEAAEEEEEDLEIIEEAEGHAIGSADVKMTDDKVLAPISLPVEVGETDVLSEQQSGMYIL